MEERAAIASHSTETTDAAWDGPANEARLRSDEGPDYYSRAYAWRDSEEDGTSKAHYAFIHHMVDGDGNIGAANLRACSSTIAILNGGRMPAGARPRWAGDREGVWRHVARHIRDGGAEPPPLRSISGDFERRSIETELQISGRQARVDMPVIRGYAAVFDQWSQPLGGFREIIRPGAFSRTLAQPPLGLAALYNHNSDYVLGRVDNGTLRLQEDDHGLHFEIQPPATQWARDLLESIRRRDVREASFSFSPVKEQWGEGVIDGQRTTTRELLDVTLYEVSPVAFPAYTGTETNTRSLDYRDIQASDGSGDSQAERGARLWVVRVYSRLLAILERA